MARTRRSEIPLEVAKAVATPEASSPVWRSLGEAGAESLKQAMEAHRDALRRRGVGLFYGSDSDYAALSTKGGVRAAWLRQRALPGAAPAAPSELRPSDCLQWACKHLEAAYRAVGLAERWSEIYADLVASGGYGNVLAAHLAADGWRGIYVNPDRRNTRAGGEHSSTVNKPVYYGIPVFDRILDYQREDERQDLSGIKRLEQIPFYFGFFRGGDHVFVGSYGSVNDLHAAKGPDDAKLIGTRALEFSEWWSGIILVPPDTWPAPEKPPQTSRDASPRGSGHWRRPAATRRR